MTSILRAANLQEVGSASDIAHLLPRCPNCGYGLRLVRGYWWCDICRVPMSPRKGPSLQAIVRQASESLRRFFSPPPRRPAPMVYVRSSPTVERQAPVLRCPVCRALTPRELPSCTHCGAEFGQPTERPLPPPPLSPRVSENDAQVYQYIVENKGEISLSKASADLHMAIPELEAAVRRLEDSRRIKRDETPD